MALDDAAWAQDSTTVRATRISKTPVIDGRLDEEVWRAGEAVNRFAQQDPVEYSLPSEKTEVTVLYDDHALYIGARMYDSAPDSILRRLVRRDVLTEADLFTVYLDPFHDRRSGYHFGLNAAGSRYDAVRYNDTWSDDSWDGVWEGAVSADVQGWTAEFRIPFSQLRFLPQDQYVWGINFHRSIGRRHEDDYLVFTPKNGSGFVSRFWNLVGLESITAPRYVELLPYARTRARYRLREPGNPFVPPSEYRETGGADVKIGLGSNLVLNATVNPDFGQVEVDPAVVNLSDVETAFDERRPFFVEGSRNFEFGSGGATDYWGFNWSTPSLFYSRRIGHAPQGNLPDNYDYSYVPEGAHILGAAKVSGKLSGNWNIGTLHALTQREYDDVSYLGQRTHFESEPATYYSVNRAQKEFNGGQQGLGFMFNSVNRMFKTDSLRADINSNAYTAGADGWTFLDKNKTYVLTAWGAGSYITGSSQRITDLQRSSRHYYQRPDISYAHVDSAATFLDGYAGRVTVNKEQGNLFMNTAVGVISPGFDINDVGFLYRADVINAHYGIGYRWTKTTHWTRYAQVLGAGFRSLDFGGATTSAGVWGRGYVQLLNYYTLQLTAGLNPNTLSDFRSRGGPRTVNKAGWQLDFQSYTDSREPWVFGLGTDGYTASPQDWNRDIWCSAEWKPVTNFSVSVSPTLNWNHNFLAYVGQFPDPTATNTYGTRYLFARLNQTELSSSIRMSWTFNPRLSLQFYAQPLISAGDYFRFKELSRPGSNDYRTYDASQVHLDDGNYTVDPDGGGPADAFSFSQPDFDVRSLQGNLILRWEYLPGSTFYLVWTHGRSKDDSRGQFSFRRSIDALFEARSDNILLAKATYWLSW
ncbi:MAG TPA: DUF5916 domain-containing protein [bacterium]|jgi:hypothetical protein